MVFLKADDDGAIAFTETTLIPSHLLNVCGAAFPRTILFANRHQTDAGGVATTSKVFSTIGTASQMAQLGDSRILRASYAIWAITSLGILFGMIFFSPATELYDEPAHMGLVRLVQRVGFRNAIVSRQNQSAAGPLYTMVHLACGDLTRCITPNIRFVNFGFLVASVATVWVTLHRRTRFAFEASVSMLAIPQLWKTTGIALTEMPALFFFSLFMAFWLCPSDGQRRSWDAVLNGVLAGIALGAAILGRQTYLVSLPVIAALAAYPGIRLRSIIAITVGLLTCGWLFILWGGLVPPAQRFVDSGIRMSHALFSFSYFGMLSFALWPQRYFRVQPAIVVGSLICGFGFAILLGDGVPIAGQGIIANCVPQALQSVPVVLMRTVFLAIGFVWVVQLLADAWADRHNPQTIFVQANVLLLALAPVKVSHNFSSRYTVGAAGAECSRNAAFSPSYSHLFVLISGTILGAASLWSHYARA